MAPKIDLEAEAAIVLEFVKEQNRPLNAQTVADFLQTRGVKKAACQKHLDAFADHQEIHAKTYGKQRIYMARQDNVKAATAEEMAEMKSQAGELQRRIKDEEHRVREVEAEIRALEMSLTDEQIEARVEELARLIPEAEQRLSKLKDGQELVSESESKEVVEQHARLTSVWRKRKGMFKQIFDQISEGVDMRRDEVLAEIGVVTDEDAGVNLDYIVAYANKRAKRHET